MRKIRNWFVCWWSEYHFNIHNESDDLKKIPDHFNEYTCCRCGKTYKL